MSFANYDIEAQKSHQGTDILTDISQQLSNFATTLTRLDKLNKQIGSQRDGKKLRNQIESIVSQEDILIKRIETKIFNLQLFNKDGSKTDKNSTEVALAKLQKEVKIVNDNFNALKRNYNEKKNSVSITELIEAKHFTANEVALNDEESTEVSETTGLLQQQQQQQQELVNKYDLDFHQLLVTQREQNIGEIQQGVAEINTIFKDINSLVLEQGVQVDTIENNLVNLSNDAQNAAQELVKANNYQQKKGKCGCILLVALVVVCLLIILAVLA